MSSEVNAALRVYLGTDENGGFNPIGCEERLMRAYPADHAEKKKLIERYLAQSHAPEWSKRDLIQEGEVFAHALKKKFPELDDVVVSSLTNRFTFNWR
jgi:hypothetical protein